MPSILNAQSNGFAPSGATVGDIINTAGGTYQVTQPGVPGASYNQQSGLWSKKLADDPFTALTAYQLGQTEANTARSEAMAQKQMDFQLDTNARAMSFSAEQAQLNREWQERLSNSAHQREVQDLIAAGLNPILSVNSQGATTPSGASAAGVTSSGSMGQVDTSGAGIMNNLVTSMMQRYMNDANILKDRDLSKNSLDVSKFIASLQADASILNAGVSAAAVQAAAAMSAAASNYAADASMYNSDNALEGAKYTADKAYESARDNPNSVAGLVRSGGQNAWDFLGYLSEQIDKGSVADQHDLFGKLRDESLNSYKRHHS